MRFLQVSPDDHDPARRAANENYDVRNWDEDVIASHTAMRLVWLIFCLVMFIHFCACLTFGVSSLQDFPERSWVHYPPPDELPLEKLLDDDAPGRAGAIFECYTHAIFSALSHMLCIGYGLNSGTPRRTEEIWVTFFTMASGASVYAIAVAFACGVISSVDYPSQLYGRTLELLNEFMRVRCLPQPLRTKVREHFARA